MNETGTWVKIRTDLFEPTVYLEIELYYKDIIQKIYDFGGYVTFTQFIRLYGKSQGAGHKLIRKLIDELRLLGEQQVNHNKYAYLKTRAMQYLKQNPKSKSVDPRPNNHVIMTSIYRAEFYLKKQIMLKSEVNANGLAKIQEDVKSKHNSLNPFVSPDNFLEEINNLHYSRCYVYRTKIKGKGLEFKFAVIDFDRSKTWYLNLLCRLDSIMKLLNEDCLYKLDILVKNDKRCKIIQSLCDGLLKDNENRKQLKERMLRSNSATARVRVQQMDNLIFKYCNNLEVTDLNIERYFLHPSQFEAQVMKMSETNKLLQIRSEILTKNSLNLNKKPNN